MNTFFRHAIHLSLALAIVQTAAVAQQATKISLMGHRPLRIGAVEGPEQTLFAGIVGAVYLTNGEMAVADGGNRVIRFFNNAGVHIRSIGREGRGPAEFVYMSWMGACSNNELLVVDPVVGRATRLSAADGHLLGTSRLPELLRTSSDIVYCESPEQVIAVLRPKGAGAPGSVMRAAVQVVRVTVASGAADTLARLSGTDLYFNTAGNFYMSLPLGARAHAAANGGVVYMAQSDERRVQVSEAFTGRRYSFEQTQGTEIAK